MWEKEVWVRYKRKHGGEEFAGRARGGIMMGRSKKSKKQKAETKRVSKRKMGEKWL